MLLLGVGPTNKNRANQGDLRTMRLPDDIEEMETLRQLFWFIHTQ